MELKYIYICLGLFWASLTDALKCLEPVYSVRRSSAISAVIFKYRRKPTGCSETLPSGPRLLSTIPYWQFLWLCDLNPHSLAVSHASQDSWEQLNQSISWVYSITWPVLKGKAVTMRFGLHHPVGVWHLSSYLVVACGPLGAHTSQNGTFGNKGGQCVWCRFRGEAAAVVRGVGKRTREWCWPC